MCIAVLTTAHPDYPFILLDNRDEYLHRPTAQATWWPSPHSHILGGYDLYRPGHGTWLGITRQGRIAVLTNYREKNEVIDPDAPSRGQLPNSWLESDPAGRESTDEAARRMIEQGGGKGMGGFSLCYGFIQDVVRGDVNAGDEYERAGAEGGGGLAIISNRTPDAQGVLRILQSAGETRALSNTAYSDRSWPKVLNGEALTQKAIQESIAAKETRDQLVDRLLTVLSTDTMPARKKAEEWNKYLYQLRNSIFIPLLDRSQSETTQASSSHGSNDKQNANPLSGGYGTQKNIIVMIDKQGKVYYLERTLYDQDVKPIELGKADRVFEFQIEDWGDRK